MNPFNKPRLSAASAVAVAATAAVTGMDEAAMKTANEITTTRIMAWHKECTAELMRLGAPEDDASALAMRIFEVECLPKGDYLSWPNADTAAQRWKALVDGGASDPLLPSGP